MPSLSNKSINNLLVKYVFKDVDINKYSLIVLLPLKSIYNKYVKYFLKSL